MKTTTYEEMKGVEEIERAAAKVADAVRTVAETRGKETQIDHVGAAKEAACHLYVLLCGHELLFGRDGAPEPQGLLRGKPWFDGFDPNL